MLTLALSPRGVTDPQAGTMRGRTPRQARATELTCSLQTWEFPKMDLTQTQVITSLIITKPYLYGYF